jgi:hypothetical protein
MKIKNTKWTFGLLTAQHGGKEVTKMHNRLLNALRGISAQTLNARGMYNAYPQNAPFSPAIGASEDETGFSPFVKTDTFSDKDVILLHTEPIFKIPDEDEKCTYYEKKT